MRSAVGHWLILALPFAAVIGFAIAAQAERRRATTPVPGFVARNGGAISVYLVLAVGLWTMLMILLPQLSMIELSFRPHLPPLAMGGPRDIYTLANYRYFLFGSATDTSQWNVLHLRAFATTIVASVFVTALDFCICYPLAYFMAQSAGPQRLRLLLLLLIVPYWLNEVLRAFAFRLLLSGGGLLNSALLWLHLVPQPIDFLGDNVAMYAGLTYAYLLLMIFPLYNAVESLEHSQIEAARDLGAPWWRIHRDVVIPFARPGIASGCTLVFMLTAGALATPTILGGPRTLWFTPIVYDRFYEAFNWPQGAAYAFMLLLACVAFVLAVLRLFRLSFGEVVR
jgi:spermidine/putrescine transport system permease protein